MIYDSPEIIPAKLYFKILETGHLSLLSRNKESEKELKDAWNKIEKEYGERNKSVNKELKKVIDLSKQIESIESRLKSIELSIYYLRHIKDEELIDKLKSYGYSFVWKKTNKEDEFTEAIFQSDLDKIERESQALIIRIEKFQKALPKKKEGEKEVPFDETVLMYASFTGLGYVDPNTIPLTQYDAMIVNGNKKMKALETQSTNGRK